MNLWLLTAVVFLLGSILVGLREHSRQVQPVAATVVQAAAVYCGYILVVGLLTAFNLFQLERIDPFFVTAGWHVFRVLYWPSWVLTFAPLMIGGVLVVVAVGVRPARRITALLVLVAVTLVAFETVFLLDVGTVGIACVQGFVFVLFSGGMFAEARSDRA